VTCPHCSSLLALLEQAAEVGLRFTPTERATSLERSRKSAEASIVILAARGYMQDSAGRWGYHRV
jgi:hypothetical protein